MRSTASPLSKLSLLFSPLDIRRFCNSNSSALVCARLDKNTMIMCSNALTSSCSIFSSNIRQAELDHSRAYAAPLLSIFSDSHALCLVNHDFEHRHVNCPTFSSGKGSLRRSDSDTYSSTGSCCTILLTASKRRRLLVAVLLCACCPAAAGLQFQTE